MRGEGNVKEHISKTIILSEGNATSKREEIRQYFHSTWDIDDQFYTAIIQKNTLYQRADQLRHPLIFYIGHTAAFYINKLILAKIISSRINAEYESMFAVGVDEMSWDDLNDANYNWCSFSDVMDYRSQVRAKVDTLITELPLLLPIFWDSPFWIIVMGIEHQRIHLETSSMLIRQLPIDRLQDNGLGQICHQDNPPVSNQLIKVKGRNIKLGKSLQNPLYGWDNEYGNHEFKVEDFQATKFLVSNHEFNQFVQAGGYHQQDLWTEEGWNWRQFTRAEHPRFWLEKSSKWYLRLVTKEIPLPWSWPVEINYLEAKAFCNWKAAQIGVPVRLPTEEEWYILYDDHVSQDQPWWKIAPGNINLEHFHSPSPVDLFQFGEFYDIIGNVWQWTETPMSGFQGFKVHPCYDDFSTPTFDGRHNMIKGGSWISTGNEATRDSRFAFRRHFFQHAGFRYVVSSQAVPEFTDFYEEDPEITPYCELDYGKDKLQLGNFSQNLALLCKPFINKASNALNIGCGTGRTAFELAKFCDKVIGIDFTARLIKVAEKMKTQQKIKYLLPEEGVILSFHEANLADFDLQDVAHKTEFWQADASNLGAKFKNYDFILAQNIFEKIYDPMNFLKTISQRLNQNGILIISSTYNWSEKLTSKDKQLGGFRKDGEPFFSLDALHEFFQADFTELQPPEDCPFLLRINNRTSFYQLAQVTFWQKK
jgi:5-histidylcysteine sulfoxide synthase/putative 4-mercaptohistidine N1-methyltranferase